MSVGRDVSRQVQLEPAATSIEPGALGPTEAYGRLVRPGQTEFLKAAGLDAIFERASGDHLWMRRGSELVGVLDLVGGYGAGLLGHNHPVLVAEAHRMLDEDTPILAQGSVRPGAAMLAQALVERFGDYMVVFTNSGTETVEAAIKHARLEDKGRIFWAVKGGFHGKTSGSMQLTSSTEDVYRDWGPDVRFLDPEDPQDWQRAELEAGDDLGAVFVEPIRGEGGVRPLPQQFVAWLNRACAARDVPLIIDEIQTGLGRTGSLLASEWIGLEPDYVCLSKVLGGGLAKIGVLLVKRARFLPGFAAIHSSTFAEDDFACRIAMHALGIIETDDLASRSAERGRWLKASLEELQRRFPEQIKEVRGRGLMVGIELAEQPNSPSNLLTNLSSDGLLGWMVAAYLLNVHNIRVAPTLSDPFTLRVQPSAYVSETDLTRFVSALGEACRALEAGDAGHLIGFRVGGEHRPVEDFRQPGRPNREPAGPRRRVAFVGHLTSPEEMRAADPSLKHLSSRRVTELLDQSWRLMGPSLLDQLTVSSPMGEEVHLSFIGLTVTARQIADQIATGDLVPIIARVQEAVDLARDLGCEVAGLGGWTSIVTGNCRRIEAKGIALTSGNSLTVGMAVRGLRRSAREAGIDLATARLAVVGAAGNISSTVAALMAGRVGEVVLIVRNVDSPGAQAVVDQIRTRHGDVPVTLSDSLDSLLDASLIVTASSEPAPLIYPEHLAPGPVAICDVAVPSDVAPSVATERPDVRVTAGGVVALPLNADFFIPGSALPKGRVFGCMAETLLMGLEGVTTHGSYGNISPESVESAMAMADRHGFTLDPMPLPATLGAGSGIRRN